MYDSYISIVNDGIMDQHTRPGGDGAKTSTLRGRVKGKTLHQLGPEISVHRVYPNLYIEYSQLCIYLVYGLYMANIWLLTTY